MLINIGKHLKYINLVLKYFFKNINFICKDY